MNPISLLPFRIGTPPRGFSPASPITRLLAVLAATVAIGAIAPSASAQWDLLTVSDTNTLMRVDLSSGPSYSATAIGVTQDAVGGPVRRIRGLAFASTTLYGMTREGDLVEVNPSTGMTTFKLSVASPPGPQFWSGLAYDGADCLYTVNAFGDQSLVKIDLIQMTSMSQGPTEWIVDGSRRQMLGVEFMDVPTFGTILLASNRQNMNVVQMDPATGTFDYTWGSQTSGVNNPQQIGVHPGTGVLWGVHDHSSTSNNAALSTFDTAFQSTELGELPFGIVESVGGGNDTYGWGGIAFVRCEVEAVIDQPCVVTDQKIPHPMPADNDYFGYSVAVSGDVAVVGAYQEEIGGFSRAGSAYVYRYVAGVWLLAQKLPNPTPATDDFFGFSVAVSGKMVVVGAYSEDNGTLLNSGSAYVYRCASSLTWIQDVPKLTANDANSGDQFGASVAVSGGVVVVGAWADSDVLPLAGSAYVYRCNGTSWSFEEKLPNPAPEENDFFGSSVAVSGDVVVAGAYGDNNLSFMNSGSAYVYRNPTVGGPFWSLDETLPNPNLVPDDDQFGYSVAVSGDVVVVGARFDDNGGFPKSGSAYVYRYNMPNWMQEQRLPNPMPADNDFFGYSVAVSDDVAVVGAYGDNDGAAALSGSAYVYRYDGLLNWDEECKKTPDGAPANNVFGISVAVSGDVVVVGEYLDDDVAVSDSGSAHVYGLCCPWDCDGDREVGYTELLGLLSCWGPLPACEKFDYDGSGIVDFNDLLLLLAAWGPCCD